MIPALDQSKVTTVTQLLARLSVETVRLSSHIEVQVVELWLLPSVVV